MIRYTQKAKDDLEIAFDWYEKQRKGLGLDFLSCIEEGILLIKNSPKLGKFAYSIYRSFIIRRFPYTIFYTIEKTDIIIHAIFHQNQNPNIRPQ